MPMVETMGGVGRLGRSSDRNTSLVPSDGEMEGRLGRSFLDDHVI